MMLSQNDLLKLEHNVSDILKTFGNTLSQEWQHIQQVSLKEHREPVTEFDVKIEKDIRIELAKLLPNAGFIVEEGGNTEDINWKTPILGKLAGASYRIRITGGAFAPYLVTGGIDAFVVLKKTK